MAGYAKLFSSIIASTIWRADNNTRIVWITLLAMADKRGIVEGSTPGLADMARIPVSSCRKALAELESPDKDSRSKEHDGRRILSVDGGWFIVNHAKYRAKMSADDRREYLRQKKAESRQRQQHVNSGQQMSRLSTHTESEADPDADPDPKIEVQDQDHRAEARNSHKVLVKCAHEVLERAESADLPLSEAQALVKDLAAARNVAYNTTEIGRALDSAIRQRSKRQPMHVRAKPETFSEMKTRLSGSRRT